MYSNPIRPAAVAGLFYPGNSAALQSDIQALLDRAKKPTLLHAPKALIVPHAGYIYSGPIAATAYNLLKSRRGTIRRVVLLGPAHRVPVRGLALPGAQALATPFGNVAVDREVANHLLALRQVTTSSAAHAMEHSLEVQLPFLQQVLGDFSLVPLVVGDATTKEVAEVLEAVWGGPETLVIISSDLSHFHTYENARRLDQDTCAVIEKLAHDVSHEQACGGTPINGLMEVARQRHLTPYLLDLRNSGDTAGDRDRVVGYASFAFTEPDHVH